MDKLKLNLRIRRVVFALVDFGGRSPFLVVGLALLLLGACWSYTRKLEVRSDVMELLPRDSPGFQAFEHRIQRVGGRATIAVVCESPDPHANERFIDAASAALHKLVDDRAGCAAACSPTEARCVEACGPDLVAFIESDAKAARSFFESKRWLYAELRELEEADATLDRRIARLSGMVEELDDRVEPEGALGMDTYREKWKARAAARDDFPTGYFTSPDGTRAALWVVSNGAGLGGEQDEQLLAKVTEVTLALKPSTFHPAMKVGFGGDIPNAKAEKDSLISEALLATSIAIGLILIGIVWFYRSLWAIPLIFFPPLFGVGCAYAFATARYGFVNSSGAFLGAIIIGNGVNYPIVLYSRYKEFRGRGMSPDVARREAVWNAFRAELVGSTVASIAYVSLTVTRFRGFNQFGIIGFVGMLLVWFSMIPCLPALIVIVERIQARLPTWMRDPPPRVAEDGSRGIVSRIVGNATHRRPRLFVAIAAVITLASVWKLPHFLRDPWEYDFDKLGSSGARTTGAFAWSAKAKAIEQRGTSDIGTLVLADTPEHVPLVKAQILANDAADPQGTLIESVTTLSDYLPGTPAEQAAKLAVLDRLRERITPGVLARVSEEDAKSLRQMIPPEGLGAVTMDDLPSLVKRRFQERDGRIGTPFYLHYKPEISTNDGHNLLRIASTVDGIVLADGTQVETASRSTVYAEMIKSLERDGPLATGVSFVAVVIVVIIATASRRGALSVVLALLLGVTWMLGFASLFGVRLNFLNFIALPITFGIGSEYPFNIYDRSRLLGGDVTRAVKLHLGAVTLCSYTTSIGYGSLLFADNQALRAFGKLAMGGEVACLLVAAFFLPSLLHVIGAHTVGRMRRAAGSAANTTHPRATPTEA